MVGLDKTQDQLKPGGLTLRTPKFQDQMDKVHLDEK
jgi:hypothetical protein